MIDFRALCVELTDCLEKADWPHSHKAVFQQWIDISHAALAEADGPAVPEGREPASVATQPSDGEVAELVADELVRQLRTKAATEKANRCHYSATLLTRAADLLQHQHPQPVAVSERMPEPNVKVLAHYFNALGKGRTICAIWVPAKSRSDEGDLDADDFLEYDEEGDTYYWPEGWYEAIENWDELGWAKVYEGKIVYWQPLPKWPAYALPTPEATND